MRRIGRQKRQPDVGAGCLRSGGHAGGPGAQQSLRRREGSCILNIRMY